MGISNMALGHFFVTIFKFDAIFELLMPIKLLAQAILHFRIWLVTGRTSLVFFRTGCRLNSGETGK